jgi:hypothetical protein
MPSFALENHGISILPQRLNSPMLRPRVNRIDMPAPNNPTRAWSRKETWWLIGAAIGMGLLVYREALLPGQILFTSDDNIGAVAMRQRWLPSGFWRLWDNSLLAGQPAPLNLSMTNLLLWLLPIRVFHNLIHAFDLAVASIGFGLFLRARGMRLAPALLGALTAFWLGSTFFLTYAGHIGKFGVVMFAGLAVWLIERAAQTRSAAWGALAGAACGGMFLEQADLALFFSMALGPYALFALAREGARRPMEWIKPLAPMGAIALMMAGRALWLATTFFAIDGADQTPESREQVWDYCTQWSWPPEETIEWIAPGYFGWRSGEPEGPYWGRLGRSRGWEETRQGLMNFKLETLYLGAIPIAFALLGLVLGMARRDRARADVIFWGAAALITFILGCGKFTPIYRLFFELPGISSIRAPVKFMQVTQFALGVLAAYGLQGALNAQAGVSSRRLGRGVFIAAAAAGFMGIVALMLAASESSAIQRFAQAGWGNMAGTIAANRAWAMGHGAILLAAAAAIAWALQKTSNMKWAWAAVALVAGDQLVVSRHYVKTVPASGFIDKNPVVDLLQQRLGAQRVFIAGQDPFYNHWLNILFPYHGLAVYNAAQMRMPADYRQFLEPMGGRTDRLWQHFAVGYVLGRGHIWPELQSNPLFKDRFTIEYAYNVFPQGAGMAVVPGTEQQRGQHIVLRHSAPAPRFALIGGWEPLDPAAAPARLSAPDHVPLARVLTPPDAELPPSPNVGLFGNVEVLSLENGMARLRVAAEQTGILRASDKYTPYWRASINGEPAKVIRCDHIFVGVLVPPGIHTVEIEHRPPAGLLYVQLAAIAAALGCIPLARRAAG